MIDKVMKPMYFSEMLEVIHRARKTHSKVDVKAYKLGRKGDPDSGHIVEYKGWKVLNDYWRGGFVRLINPVNNEVRKIPEIFIVEIMGHKVYV